MRIAIDASPAAKKPRTGTEFYTLHLILALAELDAANEYTLFLNDEVPEEFAALPSNFLPQRIPQRWLWAQTRLARELRRYRPDVFFAPANVIPFLHPPRCVATIHDVAFHYFPECYSPFVRWYLEATTRFALRRALKVIAVSRATKEDLVQIYHGEASRIEVIHSGVAASREEPPSADEIASILNREGITPPYLLYVGRLEAKKNVARIVQAFLRLKERGIPHKLVLGGSPGVGFAEIKALVGASPFVQDIISTGYVGEEKNCLYAGADVFVFPSLYEGFGFPILESFRYGTPVVTSDTSSLPEVAGDAALLVDPFDVEEIAEAAWKVIHDQKLRVRLKERGYQRLREFDWRATAADVLRVLEEAGSGGGE
ncbi:MAG: glycosyl transferase family 1 [Chloroflexi bacterium B3_Chlor]|nr:MAG: glycosyl transferase family 1 [Chloroflexi bacterium B3_Chlor]